MYVCAGRVCIEVVVVHAQPWPSPTRSLNNTPHSLCVTPVARPQQGKDLHTWQHIIEAENVLSLQSLHRDRTTATTKSKRYTRTQAQHATANTHKNKPSTQMPQSHKQVSMPPTDRIKHHHLHETHSVGRGHAGASQAVTLTAQGETDTMWCYAAGLARYACATTTHTRQHTNNGHLAFPTRHEHDSAGMHYNGIQQERYSHVHATSHSSNHQPPKPTRLLHRVLPQHKQHQTQHEHTYRQRRQ